MEAARRVLVIAYYFPPMGLSGVQRVAKLVKYLPEYGWHPTVLTVEPGGYFAYDETLLDEVTAAGVSIVRTRSIDPTRLFGRKETVRLPKESSRKWLSLFSQSLFVPDNKRGWSPFAIREGRRLLKSQRFDAVYSTAPPYTAHLIGATLAKFASLPFVADYRDDWVGNPRHTYPTQWHKAWSTRLERRVFQQASLSTVINAPIQQSLASRHPQAAMQGRIRVVHQGFDPSDFGTHSDEFASNCMQLLYTGVFYDVQTPDYFLKGLAGALESNPRMRKHLKATFVGLVPEASKVLAAQLGLEEVVEYCGYRDHQQTVVLQERADILWFTVGKRDGAEQISTGKLFEYIGARKPILALVPPGAAQQTVDRYGAGFIEDPEDVVGIGTRINKLFGLWEQQALPRPEEGNVQMYDRKEIAGQVARFLETCVRGS